MDYVSLTVNVSLSNSSSTYTLSLCIVDDDVLEANETFKAVLEADYLSRVIIQLNEAEVYILDNDSKPNYAL